MKVEAVMTVAARAPVARRPIALLLTLIAETVVPAAPVRFRPAPLKFWNVTPVIELLAAVFENDRPLAPAPAAEPLRVNWLLPITASGTVTAGSGEARLIVAGAV